MGGVIELFNKSEYLLAAIILAILAATIKLGGLATVKVHIGLLFFAVYVLLSMVLTHRLLSGYRLQPLEE